MNNHFTKYPVLGHTAQGAAWALKALHPASKELVTLQGIPDADAFPCVCASYEQTFVIAPEQEGVWHCELYTIPHPVQPVCAKVTVLNYPSSHLGMVNATLTDGATTYSDYSINLTKLAHSYRMLYCASTADLDATSLTNGGSVVAAQLPMARQTTNIMQFKDGAFTGSYAHLRNTGWVPNFPGIELTQLPGAYSGLAQDGLYQPVKIDPEAPWVNCYEQDLYLPTTTPVSPSGSNLRYAHVPDLPTLNDTFPWWGTTGDVSGHLPFRSANSDENTDVTGDIAVPLQQNNMGVALFYNLTPGSRLTVTVRWGVEYRVPVVSALAPMLKPSAQTDPLALQAYSDLAGMLPWAYPSSYNAEDGLSGILKGAWGALKSVSKYAGPLLSAIPHPVAQAAASAVRTMAQFERPSGSAKVQVAEKKRGNSGCAGKTVKRR